MSKFTPGYEATTRFIHWNNFATNWTSASSVRWFPVPDTQSNHPKCWSCPWGSVATGLEAAWTLGDWRAPQGFASAGTQHSSKDRRQSYPGTCLSWLMEPDRWSPSLRMLNLPSIPCWLSETGTIVEAVFYMVALWPTNQFLPPSLSLCVSFSLSWLMLQ